MEESSDLFGIPVPSSDKTFLAFLVIHIFIALTAVVSGLIAMLSNKVSKQHLTFGRIYLWSMLSSFIVVVLLSVMRWPHNIHLLLIGFFASILTYTGYRSASIKGRPSRQLHIICMGLSYVLLMTGFYVDNGRHLPFWKLFPQWFFWIFPAAVGLPIVFFTIKRHSLTRRT